MPTTSGPVRKNPCVLQAVSRANPLRLLNGNFTLKLNGLRESSLLDGGCRSRMIIPDIHVCRVWAPSGRLITSVIWESIFLCAFGIIRHAPTDVRQSSVEVR